MEKGPLVFPLFPKEKEEEGGSGEKRRRRLYLLTAQERRVCGEAWLHLRVSQERLESRERERDLQRGRSRNFLCVRARSHALSASARRKPPQC